MPDSHRELPAAPTRTAGVSRVRQRRIAGELRRLRDLSGLAGESVAARLGWSGSKLSRVERFQSGITLADLKQLLDIYKGQVPDDRVQALLDLAYDSIAGRVPSNAPGGHADDDEEASALLEWAALAVPPILQTREYARAALLSTQPISGMAPGAITRSADEITRWQQARLEARKPVPAEVILDESVLYRTCGSRDVTAAQLKRLLQAADLPNLQLRVLPLASSGPAGIGSFRYLSFDPVHQIETPGAVLIEHVHGTIRLHAEQDTYPYYLAFSQLRAAAASEAETARLIKNALSSPGHPRGHARDAGRPRNGGRPHA